MIRAKKSKTTPGLDLLAGLSLAVTALLLLSASAGAAVGPQWRLGSIAPTTAEPGGSIQYKVDARNVGDAPIGGIFVLRAALPAGITAIGADLSRQAASYPCEAEGGGAILGASAIRCEVSDSVPVQQLLILRLTAEVDSTQVPGTVLTAAFDLEGGGAPQSASTIDPTRIAPQPSFGIAAFDSQATDAAGAVATKAGAHPDQISTYFDYNSRFDTRPTVNGPHPIEATRDVFVETPAGLLGSAAALPRCRLSQLAYAEGVESMPLCPSASQLGTIQVRSPFPAQATDSSTLPLFNVDPPPGIPARFGFSLLGTLVVLDAEVRSDGDYGLTVASRNISEGLAVDGITTTFWNDPAAASHDLERACPKNRPPGTGGPTCPGAAVPLPLLRNPTACTATAGEGQPWAIHIDSWDNPGPQTAGTPDLSDPAWQSTSIATHRAPGYPLPTESSTFPDAYAGPTSWGAEVGMAGCEDVSFEPDLSLDPTVEQADSPTGLRVDLSIPQDCWAPGEIDTVCQSDLKEAEVRLPQGMSVNPASATGLQACTESQIGLITSHGDTNGEPRVRFDTGPAQCPDAAKIGTVEIETPLLGRYNKDGTPVLDIDGGGVPDPLTGSVYLASQTDNPFGSLLAMYLVAEGSGVVIKQAGEIRINDDGSLTTVFTDTPQQPFSNLHLELFGGPRAALKTPPSCGTYTTTSELTPWSHQGTEGEAGTPIATPTDSFQITSGPSGSPCPNGNFDPTLHAGTTNPLAGATSPFTLRMTREDGTREITGLRTTLPQGLLAILRGIPYCQDATLAAISGDLGTGAAQIASPSCPAASLVGHVTAGAGAGPNPFYTTAGRAYWAGPYHGAPVSLAVVFPAVAGPFDLGNVVIRNGFEVNPETAQITAVSDPIPTSLHEIGLDLRDIRVELDRPNYVLNPTSCDVMSFDAIISGAGGASANRSERFQAGGCDRLPFKPETKIFLSGSHTRRGHPALKVVVTAGFANEANVAWARTALPPTVLLDQSHIGTVCTRVQYAAGAGGGAECPAASIYGHAAVETPLLGYPLSGNVYLRSSSHNLPDLVVSLGGQIQVDLVGRVDSTKKGGLRATFEQIPDAFVSRFVLTMKGGKKGLLQNSTNLCNATRRAQVQFNAHNGKTYDTEPKVRADCGRKHPKRHSGHRGGPGGDY